MEARMMKKIKSSALIHTGIRIDPELKIALKFKEVKISKVARELLVKYAEEQGIQWVKKN